MITLYTWTTPNGRKISIMLEEIGMPYVVMPVDIGRREQFAPDYLRISPNNKIPAINDDAVDGGPLAIFESGAILTYLAEKSGQLLAPSGPARYRALAWLNWSIGVLERRLLEAPFLGGGDYSIADIAAYTWALTATTSCGDVLAASLAAKPSLHRWLKVVGSRPAVVRGMNILPGR